MPSLSPLILSTTSLTAPLAVGSRPVSILGVSAAAPPSVTFVSAVSSAEGNSGVMTLTYTVSRSTSNGVVTIPWSFTPGNTMPDDYPSGSYPTGGNILMASGTLSATFTVSIAGDTDVESDETFTVRITPPVNYIAGQYMSVTGTILNDDTVPIPAPMLSLSSSYSQNEGDTFEWILTLDRDGSAAAYTYNWAVTGSGVNPADASDFGGTLPSGSGRFAAGQTIKNITFLVNDDAVIEPNKTFTLIVTATGLNTVTSTGVIIDNDKVETGPFVPDPISNIAYNMSVMEFKPTGGSANTTVPTVAHMQHFADRNMKIMRLPVRWSYWQPDLAAGLDEAIYGPKVMLALDNAQATGMKVILDMHQYGYSGLRSGVPVSGHAGREPEVTINDFANFWSLVVAKVKSHPAIYMYDLYNEPEGYGESYFGYNSDGTRADPYVIPGDPSMLGIVPALFNAATTAIRALDTKTIILRGGNHYSGAWDADFNRPGGYVHNDPVNRTLFACHCYPDRDSSGTHSDYALETSVEGQAPPMLTVNPDIFEQRIAVFYNQLQKNNVKPVDGIYGVVGEIGLPIGPGWPEVITRGLNYCRSHGLLPVVWSAGASYEAGGYPFSVQPQPNDLQSEQMSLIAPRVNAPEPTIIQFTGPARAVSGQQTSPYTLLYRGNNPSARSITIRDTAGWTFPTGLMLPAGRNPSVTFQGTATNDLINIVTPSIPGLSLVNRFVIPNVDAQPNNVGGLLTSAAYDPYINVSTMPTVFSAHHLDVTTYPGPIVRLQNAAGEFKDFYPTRKVGKFYTVDQDAIADWAGGSSAPLYVDRLYDQSGGGRDNIYSGRPPYALAAYNNFPLINHDTTQQCSFSAITTEIGGQTMMLREKYISGQYVLSSTSNVNGTIGLQSGSYSVHTGLEYDRGTNVGVTSVASGLATDDFHVYAYRARTDTINGLQAFRDGTVTAQIDLTGGALTWDRNLIYQNVRPNFGQGSPSMKVQNIIYAPGALTDAEMARIQSWWNELAALMGPALSAPVYVVDPVDEPLAFTGAFTAPAYIKGHNIQGGENRPSGATSLTTANYGSKYCYGDTFEYDYFKSKFSTVARIPHRQQRLQPRSFGKLNATDIGRLRTLIDYAASKNMYVILDPHDYGNISDSAFDPPRLNGVPIGVEQHGTDLFVDYWKRLSNTFKNYPNVIFGLMNEPSADGQTALNWRDAAIAAYNAIRANGCTNLILIPGKGNYTRAQSWAETQGTIWDAWLATNPTNFMFEMHQYFDSGYRGESPTVIPGRGGSDSFKAPTDWCRARGVKAFLGEFGWSPDDSLSTNGVPSVEGNAAVQWMKNNADVWGGWAYWKAGWWKYGQGPYGIAPSFTKGVATTPDKPQIAILAAGV